MMVNKWLLILFLQTTRLINGSGAFVVTSQCWPLRIGVTLTPSSPIASQDSRHPQRRETSLSGSSPATRDNSDNQADTTDVEKTANYGPFRRNLKRVREQLSVKSSLFLPVLVSVFAGYRWGATATENLALKHPVSDIASSAIPRASRPPYLLRATVVFLVTREVWRNIPVWVKRQIPFVARRYGKDTSPEAEDENDLSSFATIARKLQTLIAIASKKLAASDGESQPLSNSEIQTALLALIQSQSTVEYSALRDARYEEGTEIQLDRWRDKTNSLGLDEVFELSDAAYDELPNGMTLQQGLEALNFTLIRHDPIALPGCVAHYIAICPTRKLAVISVKGTSNLEDFLTDACGTAVSYELKEAVVGMTQIRCHEGILLAAKRLADDVSTVVEELLIPSGYNILVTGHSLGAGVASLLGIILSSRVPALQVDTKPENGLFQVVAFAPPPILDLDAANSCALFTTSVINNSDVIPRSSLSNLVITIELLKRVNQKLLSKGLDPNSMLTIASLIKMIAEKVETSLLVNADELDEILGEAMQQVPLRDPDHLYIPGKVIQMYDEISKADYETKRDPGDIDPNAFPLDERARPVEHSRITSPSSQLLRLIEVDRRMLSDHMAPGYRGSIRTLLSGSIVSEAL